MIIQLHLCRKLQITTYIALAEEEPIWLGHEEWTFHGVIASDLKGQFSGNGYGLGLGYLESRTSYGALRQTVYLSNDHRKLERENKVMRWR